MSLKNRVMKLAYEVLNDDNGISEDAYDALIDVVRETCGGEEAMRMCRSVDACEGRYYQSVFQSKP